MTTTKGHEKCIFETLHNEIKCVLSVKESNFNKKRSKFSHLLPVRAEVVDPLPPLSVSLTVKYPFLLTTPLREGGGGGGGGVPPISAEIVLAK